MIPINSEQLLQYLTESCNIDLDVVRENILMNTRKEVLAQHCKPIWQGKGNNRWYTYLPDSNCKRGEKLVVKSSFDKLEDAIYDYYKELDKKNSTFYTLYCEWLSHKENKIRKQSIERIKRDYERFYSNAPFLNKPVREITFLELDDWIYKVIADNMLKKKCFFNMYTILKSTFAYAKENAIIAVNPLDNFKISNGVFYDLGKPVSESQVFNKNEVTIIENQLWNDFKNNPSYVVPLAILLCLNTGLRNGELTALSFSNIHKNFIQIKQQEIRYHDKDGNVIVEISSQLKTPESYRNIPITNKVKLILDSIPKTGDYLFMNKGERVTNSATDSYIRRLCEKCNLPIRSMHKLRKTYISNLFSIGLHVDKIRELSGHRDMSTLYNSYCFCNETKDEILHKLNQIA